MTQVGCKKEGKDIPDKYKLKEHVGLILMIKVFEFKQKNEIGQRKAVQW